MTCQARGLPAACLLATVSAGLGGARGACKPARRLQSLLLCCFVLTPSVARPPFPPPPSFSLPADDSGSDADEGQEAQHPWLADWVADEFGADLQQVRASGRVIAS